jgi:hypothetical protein
MTFRVPYGASLGATVASRAQPHRSQLGESITGVGLARRQPQNEQPCWNSMAG